MVIDIDSGMNIKLNVRGIVYRQCISDIKSYEIIYLHMIKVVSPIAKMHLSDMRLPLDSKFEASNSQSLIVKCLIQHF